MTLKQIAQEGKYLKRLLAVLHTEGFTEKTASFDEIILEFEGNCYFLLTVNKDTDELIISYSTCNETKAIDLSKTFLDLSISPLTFLIWSWEMKNQQGYFDALQLEFWSEEAGQALIVQFKVVASGIYFYKVSKQATS